MKKYTVRRIEKRFVDYLVEAKSDIEAWEIVDSFDEDKILKEELMTDDMPIDEAEVKSKSLTITDNNYEKNIIGIIDCVCWLF